MTLIEHRDKFATFLEMCKDAEAGKLDIIVVAFPQVLGDNYGELVDNLDRIADTGKPLVILPRSER